MEKFYVEKIPNYPCEATLGMFVSFEFTHDTLRDAHTFAKAKKLKKYRIYNLTQCQADDNYFTAKVVFTT